MNVLHIFIAPAKAAPVRSVPLVEALAGRGLEGDRYAQPRNHRGPDNEVTLIEIEHIEAFTAATNLAMTPAMPRRNIVTRGVRLNGLVGKRFRVGDAEFEGVELCEPCKVFARLTHREVLGFFAGKGGLRARIVKTGVVRVGDGIEATACPPSSTARPGRR